MIEHGCLLMNSLSLSSSASEVTVFHHSLRCIEEMTTATRELEEAFSSHSPTHSLSGKIQLHCMHSEIKGHLKT